MINKHVAAIDIGKTNAKLALVRLSDLSEIAVERRPNTVLSGPPYPHFDVEGHWNFLLDGLSRFHAEYGIEAITVTTHGAAGALIARDGSLVAPILDYEHTGPDECATAYDAIRPPFSETGSPRLSMGLNLGAQFHWQLKTDPQLRDKVHHIVTYPQFWAPRPASPAKFWARSCPRSRSRPGFQRKPPSIVASTTQTRRCFRISSRASLHSAWSRQALG